VLSRLRIASLRQLPSGIFSIVMATGIVAIAVDELALTVLAKIVFALAVLAYVLLWMLFALRLWRYWHDVRDDARRSERALGFFAIVAATSVVGTALAGSFGIPAALPLWLATLALWFAITYTILPGLMIARDKSSFGSGFNGVWLLVVVATESVAVLGAPVAAEGHAISATLEMFTALCFWLVGGMLYLWLIALIFYRCIFLPMSVEDVTPTYWINMGAMSIATLAGTSLLHESNAFVQLHTIAPFIAGITLGFWATATWWIPILLVLGFWRHVWMRYPLRYAQANWSAVFPIGMYAVATRSIAGVLGVPFVVPIAEAFAWLALCAWAANSRDFGGGSRSTRASSYGRCEGDGTLMAASRRYGSARITDDMDSRVGYFARPLHKPQQGEPIRPRLSCRLLKLVEASIDARENRPGPDRWLTFLRDDDLRSQVRELSRGEQRNADLMHRACGRRCRVTIDALGELRRLPQEPDAVVLRQAIARCEEHGDVTGPGDRFILPVNLSDLRKCLREQHRDDSILAHRR